MLCMGNHLRREQKENDMDRYCPILLPCNLQLIDSGIESDETPVPGAGDSIHSRGGSDPWYSIGFGLSSMFFSPATFGNCISR